jgi:hypothetical protein
MAVSALWYGPAIEGQYGTTAARRVDWVTDTIKVALATSSYTPNQDAHDFFNDITNEVSGTGYTAGGATLGTKSVVLTGGTNTVALIAATSVWTTATFTARYAIVYKDTGTASTSPVLGYVDFGGDQTVNAATFSIVWDATAGVLKGVYS